MLFWMKIYRINKKTKTRLIYNRKKPNAAHWLVQGVPGPHAVLYIFFTWDTKNIVSEKEWVFEYDWKL